MTIFGDDGKLKAPSPWNRFLAWVIVYVLATYFDPHLLGFGPFLRICITKVDYSVGRITFRRF